MQVSPPRGTRDFFPEEMRFRNWLFSVWRETASRYGFEEYDSSILEQEELYVLKSGQEILSQLFNFTDKGGRRVALRPEMTPSLARMIAAKGGSLAKPLKWFSIVQCFRYERMSKGRKREHYQWNLDIVGVPEVAAEAELIAVALDVLKRLGLDRQDVVVRVSHRGLLSSVLQGLGVVQDRWMDVFGVIDKRGKEPDDALWKRLIDMDVPEKTLKTLFTLLDEKSMDVFYGFLDEKGLDAKPAEDLRMLFEFLESYGVTDSCEFSPSIVRGLPYYTGIVFECFDREGRFRAVFGGGRYDNLLEIFSAGKHPAVGLGFGDVVIQELLEEKKKLPQPSRRLDLFLVPYSETERPLAIQTVQRLRSLGFFTDILLNNKRLKGAMKEAARSQAKWVLLLLPEELKKGLFVIRDLKTGTEERIPQERFWDGPESFLNPEERCGDT